MLLPLALRPSVLSGDRPATEVPRSMAPPQTVGKPYDDPSAEVLFDVYFRGRCAQSKTGRDIYGVDATAVSEEMSVCVVSSGGAISETKSSIRPQKLASPE
jgi:hypothetical protein